jgi:hypothetical protein
LRRFNSKQTSSFAAQKISVGTEMYNYNYVIILMNTYGHAYFNLIPPIILPTSDNIYNNDYTFANSSYATYEDNEAFAIVERTVRVYSNTHSTYSGYIEFYNCSWTYLVSGSSKITSNTSTACNVPMCIIGFN